MSTDEDDWEPPKKGGAASVVLPVVVAGVSLAVGLGLGFFGGMLVPGDGPPEAQVVEKEVARELTMEEIDELCEPYNVDARSQLEDAQSQVVTLKGQIDAKEAKVQELEDRMKKGAANVAQLRAELDAAKQELEETKAALVKAETERDEFREQLQEALDDLDVTIKELEQAKEETREAKGRALNNRWAAFQGDVQLEICDHGGRRRMGKCREAVMAALTPAIEAKFRHCIKSGQAVPLVGKQEKRKDPLPDYGEFIDEDSRFTKSYWINYCDPSLPEAKYWADANDEPINTSTAIDDEPLGGGADDDEFSLDGLEDLDE